MNPTREPGLETRYEDDGVFTATADAGPAETDPLANAWLMAAIGLATMLYAIALNGTTAFQ